MFCRFARFSGERGRSDLGFGELQVGHQVVGQVHAALEWVSFCSGVLLFCAFVLCPFVLLLVSFCSFWCPFVHFSGERGRSDLGFGELQVGHQVVGR
jgi:hypothetical protein